MLKYIISYIHFEGVPGPASSAVLIVALPSDCPAAKAVTTCFWREVCRCCTNVLSQQSMAPSHGTGCNHRIHLVMLTYTGNDWTEKLMLLQMLKTKEESKARMVPTDGIN